MLKFLREQLNKLLEQRAVVAAERDQIIATAEQRGELTDDDSTRFEERRAAVADLDGQIDEKRAKIAELEADEKREQEIRTAQAAAGTLPEARRGGAVVTREERTYTADKATRGEASFFSDAFRSTFLYDAGAQQRLARHAQEITVDDAGLSLRATTTTSFGGLIPPKYLVDEYTIVLRNGRPVANAVNRMPLPDTGMSVVIPRGTTGAAVASQATQNTALQNTDEVFTDLTVPVVTIGGQQDVSRQSLERGTPGIDRIVFNDLIRAYNAELDRQVIAGTGASGQMLGISATSGINQATAYVAAVTSATFFSKTAGAVSSVASAGTEIIPQMWVMHPRRWFWLTSQLDSQGRPIVVPAVNGIMNGVALNSAPGAYSGDNGANPPKIVGYFHGLPVITDANVPTAVGSGPEDIVLLMDTDQAYLWEDNGGVPRQLKFEQTLGNQLTVKLVLYNYAAFTAGRFPVAFAQVGGNSAAGFGHIAPTF